MKTKSLIAVLAGAGVGVFAGIGFRGAPDDAKPPPLAPVAARPIDLHAAAPSRATRTEPSAAGSAHAEASPASESAPSVALPPAPVVYPIPLESEVPIASKAEFEAAAIACDAKDAAACRRAAAAAELGAVVQKDRELANRFRRVELTVLVRGCEKRSVEACLTLADRYLRGDGVGQSERTATALVEHCKEICARRPEDACRNVPANE